jgi:N-methylhydantoinase A
MRAQGLEPADATMELTVEARYAGQVWELEVPLRPDWTGEGDQLTDVVEGFHRLHEEIFAVRDERSDVEMVGWHARLRLPLGIGGALDLAVESELPDEGERSIYVAPSGWCSVPVYGSARIRSVTGPAVLELPGTTIVLDRGAVAVRSASGSILVAPRGEPAQIETQEAVDVV